MKRKTLIWIALLCLLATVLAGCGALGGADYVMEKNADGSFKLRVHTNREIEGGVKFRLTADGGIEVITGGVSSGDGLSLQDAVHLQRILQPGGAQ